ncbi:MAG TPA: bifunctional alpha,alpha-trehalose-phosphate synthase (UDP-forming)/trehalose-phosphatase, partial [Caldithrix sp.]|nr:bifunctional alpha,alpha-trehalose-phosphate synthase (UDP-forming)/trehalose-phosphatase [Caldithrix sp.]
EDNRLEANPSVGGLATGLKSVHQRGNSLWIGWPGIANDDIPKQSQKKVDNIIKNENCYPVYLNREELELFYDGFSNKTIWPLFHYFTQYATFEKKYWDAYTAVNEKYAKAIIKNIASGDQLWIHDYQLLLVPQMVKEQRPDVQIGFFLHIPFPSFEVFRILPWRNEVLEGMLGSDLIGFHTYNYERHFLSSVRRLLGFDINFNQINLKNRIVLADTFPMGIDYNRFHQAASAQQKKTIKDKLNIQQELNKHLSLNPDLKFVLSIDRLDYTKGIATRLNVFEYFLDKYPEYQEKVTLIMLTVPSRSDVEEYQLMKSEVDELVGRINGKYSTINWTPVWYFYRSLPFENLVDLYATCQVALLTPIRDGMNLVAKEYIASRIDKKGVLIISEMAGVAQEMSEALIINPNNYEEIADALNYALGMPEDEQIERNSIMQDRLKRYNVEKWSEDFLRALVKVKELKNKYNSKKITPAFSDKFLNVYKKSKKRILFLDYDGTLVGFKKKPEDAYPDNELYSMLDLLARDRKNSLVLVSGRDKETFNNWFGNRDYYLIAEHGVWMKNPKEEWQLIELMQTEWMESIKPIIEYYIDRTPGTFMEEKKYSLVWHYRKADPELGTLRANELRDELSSFIANHNLEILEGKKVIEVKNSGFNKGRAAVRLIQQDSYDFILGIGDDWTDEYLFEELPKEALTIRVGLHNTFAKYNFESFTDVRDFLKNLSKTKTD